MCVCTRAYVCGFVCVSGLSRAMTLSSSDTQSGWRVEWGRHEGNSSRGKEGLFMVPYFLSQHPLLSRGKSIPKVKGHPGGIPFVFYAMPYMFSPMQGVCFCLPWKSVHFSLCAHQNIWSHWFFLELTQVWVLDSAVVSLLCSISFAARNSMTGNPSRKRKVIHSVQWRQRSVLASHQHNNTALCVQSTVHSLVWVLLKGKWLSQFLGWLWLLVQQKRLQPVTKMLLNWAKLYLSAKLHCL